MLITQNTNNPPTYHKNNTHTTHSTTPTQHPTPHTYHKNNTSTNNMDTKTLPCGTLKKFQPNPPLRRPKKIPAKNPLLRRVKKFPAENPAQQLKLC